MEADEEHWTPPTTPMPTTYVPSSGVTGQTSRKANSSLGYKHESFSSDLLRCEDFKCVRNDDIGELGSGVYSIVRLAYHEALNKVAVKCFSVTGDFLQRNRLEEKITKEMKILKEASNDSVVKIHGWVKWARATGIVMEYLPSGCLGQFVDEDDRLHPALILRMALEIASGLAHLHSRQLVHGDIKPENILLTEDLHCKIGDFGSASLHGLTGATTATKSKKTNYDCTMVYAAPERMTKLNSKPTKEQDVYSFGMLLYVLMSAKQPLQGVSEAAFIDAIKKGDRPDKSEIEDLKRNTEVPQIVAGLEDAIDACWVQSPNDRPSMVVVQNKMQNLFCNVEDVLLQTLSKDISDKIKQTLDVAKVEETQELVELQHFLPESGQFTKGNILNVYYLNNATNVAIDCSKVSFSRSTPDAKIELIDLFESKDTSKLPSKDGISWPELRRKYIFLLKDGKFAEANELEEIMCTLIVKNVKTSAQAATNFAKQIVFPRKLESFMVFDSAVELSNHVENVENRIGMIEECIYGMKESSKALIGGSNPNPVIEAIVEHHVIPLMYKNLNKIKDMSEAADTEKWNQIRWSQYHISYTFCLIGKRDEEKNLLEITLEDLKKAGDGKIRQGRLLGILLNNLAAVYEHKKQLKEAARYYQNAIDICKSAADYKDETERAKDLKLRKKNLKRVKPKLFTRVLLTKAKSSPSQKTP